MQRSYNMLMWDLKVEAECARGKNEGGGGGDGEGEGEGEGVGGTRDRGEDSDGGEGGGEGSVSGECFVGGGGGVDRQSEKWVLETVEMVEIAARLVPSEAFRVYELAATAMGQLGHLDRADEMIDKALAAHDAYAKGLMVKGELSTHAPHSYTYALMHSYTHTHVRTYAHIPNLKGGSCSSGSELSRGATSRWSRRPWRY